MCVGKKRTREDPNPSTMKTISRDKTDRTHDSSVPSLHEKTTSQTSKVQKSQVKTSSLRPPSSINSKQVSYSAASSVHKVSSAPLAKKGIEAKPSDFIKPSATPASIKGAGGSTPEQKENVPTTPTVVDPPRKLYARRKVDKMRDAKDVEYKTLADLEQSSEWEGAEIVKRVDLKKEKSTKATLSKKKSTIESRKSKRKVETHSEPKDDGVE